MQRRDQGDRMVRAGGREGPPFVCEYCGLGGFPTLSALHGHRRSHVNLVRDDRSFSSSEALLFMAGRFGGVTNLPGSYRDSLDQQLGITRAGRRNNARLTIDLNSSPPPESDQDQDKDQDQYNN